MTSENVASRHLQLLSVVLVIFIQLGNAFCLGNCSALSVRNRPSRPFHKSRTNATPGNLAETIRTKDEEEPDQATLVLRADYVGESKAAPSTSQQAMVAFFRDPQNRNCLISAGNTRETHCTTTDELRRKWKIRASSLGAEVPEANDTIVRVRIGRMRFPGVTLESTSLIGTKLVIPTWSNAFPSYEFVLIQDKREATGLKPLVWVYNLLVGKGDREREKDTTPTSLSRVTVQESNDGKFVTFKIETILEICVNFSAILLKLLPVKKEKAEAQGSSAVSRILRKDIDLAITTFRDTYAASMKSTHTPEILHTP
jgi:hypothetical protein